ncbi:MAG: ABC transporter permease [Polyangia bacterium]|jgi:ABC-type polysaccharide/polyol phosphate export permease|nr:ABC transporter permease [Polyangia bacterium]
MERQTLGGILKELWTFRVYLKYETLGKIKLRHKGTYLGYLWWVLDPLFLLAIYYFMFKIVLRHGRPNYVLFLFCALLPWRWFSTSASEATLAIRSSAGLIKQVYFPKIIAPLATIFTNTVNFAAGLLILALLMALHKVPLHWSLVCFPLIALIQLIFTVGVGLILADIDVYARDTESLMRHVLNFWFYLSPGLYSIDMVPERLRLIFAMNPFTTFFEAYRDICMYGRWPNFAHLGLWLLLSLGLMFFGAMRMARHQGDYAKVI